MKEIGKILICSTLIMSLLGGQCSAFADNKKEELLNSNQNIVKTTFSQQSIKGTVVAGYLKDPKLKQIKETEHYEAPESEVVASFASVEELSKSSIDFKVGDYVATKGYYAENDGGGAVYLVADGIGSKETYVTLANGLKGKLVSANNTVSVLQFGAKGDGVTDDFEALNQAFSSGFFKILLNGKTYLVNRPLWIKNSNVVIEGMGATITCNDNYDFKNTSNQILIYGVSNVTFQHLRILDGMKKLHTMEQIQCMQVENLNLNYCTLEIPEATKDSKEVKRGACNLSYRTGWKNVSTTHCEIINMAGHFAGGALGYNDMYNFGGENAVLSDNIIRYNCKDEVIAIFGNSVASESYFNGRQSYIRNIKISNNEFYAPNSDRWERAWGFAIGYADSREIDKVIYENNYFEVDSVCGFGYFSKICRNSGFRNNEIHSRQNGGFFKSDTEQYEPIMEGNQIYITKLYDDTLLGSLVTGKYKFRNNEVTIDGNIGTLFAYEAAMENNKIQINGNVKKVIGFQSGNLIENQITVTGTLGTMFESYIMDMKEDIIWRNNTIEAPNTDTLGALFLLNGMKMNGHIFTMEGNTIKTPSVKKDIGMIYDDLKDDNPTSQKIVLKNNNFGPYKTINNKVQVYRVGNTVTLSNGTQVKDYEVKFDAGEKVTIPSQSVIGGNKIAKPSITLPEGQELLGWYQDKNYTREWIFDKDTVNSNITLYAKVKVTKVEKIYLNYGAILGEIGEVYQMIPIFYPENCEPQEVAYESSNQSVFTVTDQGVVTLVGKGEAILTVYCKNDKNVKVQIPVTVEDMKTIIDTFTKEKVTGLKRVKNTKNSIQLKWDKVTNAKEYEIYRYTGNSTKRVKIATCVQGVESYNDGRLTPGQMYSYEVVAKGEFKGQTYYSEGSDKLATATVTKEPSISVKKYKVSKKAKNGKIKISWNRTPGASGYYIYVSLDGGKHYKRVKTVKSSKAGYINYSAKKKKTVCVKIKAYKKVGKATYVSYFSKTKKIKL